MAYENAQDLVGTNSSNPFIRLKVTDIDRFIISSAATPQSLTRYNGGHRRDNHPHISGYWYFLVKPPEYIFGVDGSDNYEKAQYWMFTTAESFTPPSRTLNKVEIPGMGGMKSSYVSGQEISTTFSVTFREYQELPILNILQTWTSIVDPNTGTSPLGGEEFIPANYKGSAFAVLCKPTVGLRDNSKVEQLDALRTEDIEQIFYFDGVWPESAPWDSLTNDISTNDSSTISVNFNFDGYPLLKDSPGVIQAFLDQVQSFFITDSYLHSVNSMFSTNPTDRTGSNFESGVVTDTTGLTSVG
jgi:hypothetical protein